MGKSVVNIKSNFVYQVIYSVQNKQHGLKFPIERVEEYLVTEGYKKINIESNSFHTVMIKGENKVFISPKLICFEALSEDEREKYNQKFTSYIILRYKIFLDATRQNIESAKNNLIQNKLRTCVSNMYYSLHNGISAMVEYYKSINESLTGLSNENLDNEAFLGHFIPAACKVFLENIDGICESDKYEYIKNDKLRIGSRKSENNPFSWIYPLFYDKICNVDSANNEFNALIEDMATSLLDVSLENIAVDDTQKRSAFEKELKKSLEIIKKIINEEDKNSIKYSLAVLSGYFSYAYMLRQLADYDSLFEVKVNHKEIIRWTITSSQFVDILLSYLDICDNEVKSKIQIINARSSKETLNDLYSPTDKDLMTITGIIIDRNFNLFEYVTCLLKKTGYSLFNQNNEIPNYDENTNKIIMRKTIFMTPYSCFITMSNTGIFRIDVVLLEDKYKRMKDTVNSSYLERFIHKEILEEDFQQLLSTKGKIVVGAPIIYQDDKYSKLQLLLKTHEMVQFRHYRQLDRILTRISDDMYDEKILVAPVVLKFTRDEDISRSIGLWRSALRRIIRDKSNFNSNIDIILILIGNSENILDKHIKCKAIDNIKRMESIENNIEIEYINFSDENVKQLLYGDQSYIRSKFNNIIDNYKVSESEDILQEDIDIDIIELEEIAISECADE